jgi:serine/threonine-protein kinase
MSASEEQRARFEREIKVEQHIRHENLARFIEVGAALVDDPELVGSASDDSGRAMVIYLVREWIEGQDLSSRLAAGPLPVPTALDVARQVALGLAAIHERGVIHRNVNPESIRLTKDGKVKLLDFGMVKILKDELDSKGYKTAAGKLLGKAPYLSPEQIKGQQVDIRTDLFSLGILLYEMITGRTPFPHSNLLEYFHALDEGEPRPLADVVPGISGDIEKTTAKLLAKEPADRYESAAVTARELEALAKRLGFASTGG